MRNALEIVDLTVRYGRGAAGLTAVDRATLTVARGTTVGLVGESGSGKSSLARAVVGLVPPAGGIVLLEGERMRARGRRPAQMVFQDPLASLDPRMPVGVSVGEGLLHRQLPRAARRAEVERLFELVSLDRHLVSRLPQELSGGQLQRAAIARALAAEPRLLVADEITSALDVSVQAAILNLLRELRRRLGLSTLLVSHNLAVVRAVSDVVAVMHLGQIVEVAATDEILGDPRHPYTRSLLDAVPTLGPVAVAEPATVPVAEPPDGHAPPTGCRFHPRCPVGPLVDPRRGVCVESDPLRDASGRRHRAACHFAGALPPPQQADLEPDGGGPSDVDRAS